MSSTFGALAPELAMSSIVTEWRLLRTHVWAHRSQVELALRVTIAALLSLVVAQLLNVPLPLWTVLTAVILTQVSFGKSVKATVDYLIGTLCGAIYAGAVSALLPHTGQVALISGLAIAVAPLALLAAINPTFGAAPFTGVLVVLIPGVTHVGPIESALYRVIEVAVGGITAIAVSFLVLPARAHSLAIEAAAQMLNLMAKYLPEFLSCLMHSCDASAIGRLQDSIGKASARADALAGEARHERISFISTESSLGPLLRTLLRLRHDFVMIGRAAAVPLPEAFQTRLGSLLAQVTKTTAEYLRQSGEALTTRPTSTSINATEAALDDYAKAFDAARREGLTLGLPVDTVERIFTLGFALDQLRQHLRDLERCVTEAARWR
jgi:uncharacterized membrane protein YccC